MTTVSDAVAALRPYLFSIAYRMVGSASEAEDLVQEAFVRYVSARRAEPVQSERAYLSTIVTRLCIDHLGSARVKREAYVGPWLPEPVLTDREQLGPLETVEQREAVSMAMLVLLERLSAEERAVFVLHEAFEFLFSDVGSMLGKSAVACRQLFHRAEQFLLATQRGDLQPLSAALAADVTVWGDGGGRVAATRSPIVGRDAVLLFFERLLPLTPPDLRLEVAEVNGAPAVLGFVSGELNQVSTFEIDAGCIVGVRGVLNPDKLAFMRRQLRARAA